MELLQYDSLDELNKALATIATDSTIVVKKVKLLTVNEFGTDTIKYYILVDRDNRYQPEKEKMDYEV